MEFKHRVIIWLGASLIVVSGVIGVLFIATTGFDLSTGCGNDILQTSLSPDGKHQAIYFQRSCGATTSYAYGVSVLPSQTSLPNESGNVTNCVNDEPITKMKWVSEQQLNLYYQQAAPCATRINEITVKRITLP
jgi:hypothetical protein